VNRNADNTLWGFFQTNALNDQQAGTVWASECLSKARQEFKDKVPGPFWSRARGAIDQALQQALSVPMSDILAAGWSKYRELIQYRDRKKHPAAEVALVPLHSHTISSVHKPQIEIFVNDRRLGSLDFDLSLALEIEMAILKIQDGKIWEVSPGSCRGSGTLMFGPAVLLERKTSDLQLPAMISFTEGLSI